MMKGIMGIDPGKTGGIVILSRDKNIISKWIVPTIDNHLDFLGLFKIFVEAKPMVEHAFLEQVHSMKGQGVSSTFSFGRTYGATEMCLVALGISYELVTPQRWTKVIHAGVEGGKELKAKDKSLIAFNRLFPGVDLRPSERSKNHHFGELDALLIAEFGRRSISSS